MKFLSKDMRVELLDDAGNVLWTAHHGGNPVVYTSPDGLEFGYDPAADTGYVKKRERDDVDTLTGVVSARPVDMIFDKDGRPLGGHVHVGMPRRLPEPGPYDDGATLVCDRAAEHIDRGAAGEAFGRCQECDHKVWIYREHISLFGKKGCGPPAVVCRECYGEREPAQEINWASVDMRVTLTYYENLLKEFQGARAQDYVRKIVEATKSMKDVREALGRVSQCRSCGRQVRDGSGRKRCQECQRKQWRRT